MIREFNKQVQIQFIFFIKHSFGVEKLSFALGLLLIFSIIFVICCWLMCSNVVDFGMYCLINPFIFSIAPFYHEEYGSAKQTGAPILLVIFSCKANSKPLSVVIVLITSLYGQSKCMTASASLSAFLPCFYFRISSRLVLRSVRVTIAP